MLTVIFISLFVFFLIGVPIAFSIGLASVASLLIEDPALLISAPQRIFVMCDSFPIMALPFFILAGEIMSRGGISDRLVRLSQILVSNFRAGLAMAAVVACMIFAGISGSAAADASAIGAIIIPAMLAKRYKKGFVASLMASASSIGPIIPPSMIMIVYSSLTGVSIAAMFLGGVVPGFMIGGALMLLVFIYSYRKGYGFLSEKTGSFSWAALWDAFKGAFFALLTPVIIFFGIIGGIFTATEAGVVASVYALLVSMFIYRTTKLRDLPSILVDAMVITCQVMIIVAMAGLFGWLLAKNLFHEHLITFLYGISSNPHVILLVMIVFLLILTMFVEGLAALIILAPVLAQLGTALNMHPIHFGVTIVLAMMIGAVTPPVGVLLFITTSLARADFREVWKSCYPFILALMAVLFTVAYIPILVTWLPDLVMK